MAVIGSEYRIVDELDENSHSVMYRVLRESDGQSFLAEVLKEEFPSIDRVVTLKRDHEIASSLRHIPGVIQMIALEKINNRIALFMEDFRGRTLESFLAQKREFTLEEVLEIGVRISEGLDRIHSEHVIHKNLNPSSILFHPESFELRIIHFGLASLLPQETPGLGSVSGPQEILRYLSPEQTGRSNYALDYRSDYYSFGAILYHLAAGRAPFEAADPAKLIHLHLTKIPVLLSQIRQGAPRALAEIVHKLLSKNPGERYQTAVGIRKDLAECLSRIGAGERDFIFPVGAHDLSENLVISQKFYGRESEVEVLQKGLQDVIQGKRVLVLVSGYSGVGKTSLVRQLFPPLIRWKGYYVAGKFDQLERSRPYTAFVEAFRELLRQVLAEPQDEIEKWRKTLLEALGANGQIMVELVPELEQIIGKQPALHDLDTSARQNRFLLVIQKFIGVFATADRPMVMFLDDLQWIDSASLRLLELVTSSPDTLGVYLIGAYRDSEITAAHPLLLTLVEIQKREVQLYRISLPPLSLNEVNALLGDTLHCDPRQAFQLAQVLHEKTDGNPFSIKTFLQALFDEGCLKLDPETGAWEWTLETVRRKTISENVADLLVEKLEKLPFEALSLLKCAACIGCQFDLDILSFVLEKSPLETIRALWPIVVAGHLIPLSHAYRAIEQGELEGERPGAMEYKFAHDRVQQVAYSMISEVERLRLHLKIGLSIRKKRPPEKNDRNLFEIVNHLNLAFGLVESREQKDDLARLNLLAGVKAKGSAAYAQALKHFTLGMELMGREGWTRQFGSMLSLHEEAAEVACLTRDFATMDRLLNEILDRTQGTLEKVRAHKIRIDALAAQNKLLDCVRIALAFLGELGFSIPENPSRLTLLKAFAATKISLFGKSMKSLIHLKDMTDGRRIAAIQIMRAIAVAVYVSNSKLMALLLFYQVRLVARFGHTPLSPSIFASYGIVLCSGLKDVESGYQAGILAMDLLEKYKVTALRSRVTYAVNIFNRHRKEHVRHTLQPLSDGYKYGIESGDFESAALNAHFYCEHSYFMGKELGTLLPEVRIFSSALEALGQPAYVGWNKVIQHGVSVLLGHSSSQDLLSSEDFDEKEWLKIFSAARNNTGIFINYTCKAILCVLFGRHRDAYENTLLAFQSRDSATSAFGYGRFLMVDSLARIGVHHESSNAEKKRILRQVEANQREFRPWMTHAPMNYQHSYFLVEAERFRVLGLSEKASAAYDQAIARARESGFLNDEALSSELAACFFLEGGRVEKAKKYILDARYAYLKWGAVAKVKDIEQTYRDLFSTMSRNGW